MDRGLATRGAADIGVSVLLADFAVGMGHDVVGVGVHLEESGDLGDDAGFLHVFADSALGGGLADVLGASGQFPLAGIAAALEQDGSAVVDDEQVAGRDEGVGLRCGGSL